MGRAVQAAARRVDDEETPRPESLDQYSWHPQPGPQQDLIHLPDEIFEAVLGGARGGGKTDAMLGDWQSHAHKYGLFASGVFFRRTAKQLEEVIARSKQIYPLTGAVWRKQEATWEWVSGPAKGARLKMRHLWDDADAANYQGHAYTWTCFEELTNWPNSDPMDKMRATLRSAHGVPCKLRATCNPGGPGHNWVKARYIEPARLGYTLIRDPRTQEIRVFIPAKLEDNPALTSKDPMYEHRLMGAGSEALVKAWRYGEWDIIAGGFFDDVWKADIHIIDPFEIPSTWIRSRSFDWGHAKPSSLGMWAESDGNALPNGRRFPRGSLIRTNEWYTAATGPDGMVKPNEGQRTTNNSLGEGIGFRAGNVPWRGCVADPSIFTDEGGDSIYKQMVKGAKKVQHRLIFNKADNSDFMDPKPHENPREHPEDYGYCVFGEVVEGMDVLEKISKVEVLNKGGGFDSLPKRTVLLKSAKRFRRAGSQRSSLRTSASHPIGKSSSRDGKRS